MRDYEDPVHVPPLALKIFTAGLVAALVVAPIVVTLRSGYIGNILSLLSLGFAGVGFVLGAMFVYRLILWFVFAFYWYLAAAGGIALFMLSLAYIGNIATMPELPDTRNPSPAVNIAILAGVVLGVVALYLIFRPGGVNQSRVVQPPIPVTPPPAPTPQKQILKTAEQLAARKKDLGLDDEDKTN